MSAATTSETKREAVACDLCGKDDVEPLVVKQGFRVVRCRGCQLVYVNPRLRPSALAALYDVDTYQHHQITRAHDDKAHREALGRLGLVQRFAPNRGKLLDVGCSTGFFLGVGKDGGFDVVGLDVSERSVAHVRSKGCDVRLATLETHDLPAASFEVITMFDSIEHMPSPMTALRAVHSLLAPGGVVVLTTPNVDGILPRMTYQLFGRTFGGWEHPGPPGHIYQFSKRTLSTALERTGFSLMHVETEAIALKYTVGALEDVIVDALKGKSRRPSAEDARLDVEESRGASAADDAPAVGSRTRLLRRAVRRVARTAAWALTGAVAAPAPYIGQGDSLIAIARKR